MHAANEEERKIYDKVRDRILKEVPEMSWDSIYPHNRADGDAYIKGYRDALLALTEFNLDGITFICNPPPTVPDAQYLGFMKGFPEGVRLRILIDQEITRLRKSSQ